MPEPPRIDLADPSDEGSTIAEALRGEGYTVVERSIASLTEEGSDARLILLAGDVPEAIDALAALNEQDDVASIVLLGHPDDAEDREVTSVRPLGADAHYSRPVSMPRLLRKVETLLSPPETRLSPPPEGDAEDASKPAREPTLIQERADESWGDSGDEPDDASDQGDDPEMDPPTKLDELFEEEGAEVSGVAEVTGVSFKDDIISIEQAASLHDPDNPISQVARRPDSRPPPPEVAVLSPRLTKIFREADRRVFPDEPVLDLELPDRQESARELVPDDLLEVVVMPTETREEDPLEAFTYVGVVPPELVGAPLPLPEAAQRFKPSSMTGELPPARPVRTEAGDVSRPSRPPKTHAQSGSVDVGSLPSSPDAGIPGPETHEEETRDEPTRESVEQHGVAEGLDVLRFLMSIARLETPAHVRLELPDRGAATLSVASGKLLRLSADVHVIALRELARIGRVDEAPPDEAGAAQLLDERIRAGTIGRFEADRALRRARETFLYDLATAESLEFDVRPAEPRTGDPGLLGSPLAAVFAEGVRRRVDATRLRVIFGGGDRVLDVADGVGAAGEELGLEPEIVSAVQRHDGASVDAYLGSAPAEEGLAGALLALDAVGVLSLHIRAADHTGMVVDPQDSVRALVESAYALAEEGCYFDVLGAPADAKPREIRAAYEARRDELTRVDLEALGLAALASKRDEAVEVIDEAFQMLRDEELRRAYRRALGL